MEDRVVLWGLQAASWENFPEKSPCLHLNSDDRCLSVTYLCVKTVLNMSREKPYRVRSLQFCQGRHYSVWGEKDN